MASAKVMLTFDIWRDIQRHILSYIVMLLVVFSAFAVIYFTHLNRQTTSQLEVLLTDRDELDIEWRNLLIEQSSLAEHSEIESRAKKLLQMKKPGIDSEITIKIP